MMFSKNKTPSPAKARKMSQEGHNRCTKAVINSCIHTLDSYIHSFAENGEYHAHTWFRNNSGFLTPKAMDVIAQYYQKLGYLVEVKQDEDIEGVSESYYIEISWRE